MASKSSVDQIRENLRLQQLYNVFMRYGMDAALDRGFIGVFRRRMQQWIYSPDRPLEPLSPPVKVRLLLQELGPTYVKMGQIISSRADVLPPEWEEEFNKLQSNVPPFPIEQVHEIIVDELGAETDVLFATFDEQPLAAASTAQVHRATLADGQEVVVKVQRPNIVNQVKSDIGILLNASRAVENRAEWAKEQGLTEVIEEFGKNIVLELDYQGEAYNARRISKNMDELPGVHIPIIYSELTTSKVLTMEFMHGVKISNIPAIQEAGLDRDMLAENTVRSLVKQLLIDGFFHGDPHPGNVLVDLDTGIINYIDLGMVGELNFQQRVNLIQLLMVVQQHDSKGLAQVMIGLSTPYRDVVDERSYYRNFDRQVGRYLEPDSGGGFSQAVSAALDLLRDSGLRLDPELTLALKALIQLEAITSRLLPEGGLVELADRQIRGLVIDEVTPERVTEEVKKQATFAARELANRLPTLQEATLKWLNQYERGRFELYMDTSDLTEELGRARRVAVLGIVGLLLSGMIIGSAIAIGVASIADVDVGILPQVAFVGYVLSMGVAGLAVFVVLWRIIRNKPLS
jgi:ubiquinone biosynthesis protein